MKLKFYPRYNKSILFLLFISLAVSWPAAAETLVLKSGETIEGRMLDMTSESITLEIFGVPKTYGLADVKSVDGRDIVVPPSIRVAPAPSGVMPPQETIVSQEPEGPPVSFDLSEPVPAELTPPDEKNKPEAVSSDKSKVIKKLKEKVSNEALSYFEIGYIHKSLGEDKLAAENYKKALSADPELGQKFFNQALDDFYLDRIIPARDKFLRARELFEVQDDARMVRLVNQQIRELYNNPDEDRF